MKQKLNQLKQIDDLLFEELKEVSEFEAELFSLEYELDEEEKVIAKLHNSCRMTVMTIKHLHTLIRKANKTPRDKSVSILKEIVRKQIILLENNVQEAILKLNILYKDEKAGEKIVNYCKKVESIVRKKINILKRKLEDVEKNLQVKTRSLA